MGAKGVDPLREGANARRHKPQAQRRVCAGPSQYSEAWILHSHHPIAKGLGFQSLQGDLRAEDIKPGVLDMGATWRSCWKVPLNIGHPTEKQLGLRVSCVLNTW